MRPCTADTSHSTITIPRMASTAGRRTLMEAMDFVYGDSDITLCQVLSFTANMLTGQLDKALDHFPIIHKYSSAESAVKDKGQTGFNLKKAIYMA